MQPVTSLTLSLLPEILAVCRLSATTDVPNWVWRQPFFCVTRTHDELSLVLPQAVTPSDWQMESDWRALKVEGPLDFSLTGILASLATPLAQARISIFALSTYDTDYLLVRASVLPQACQTLTAAGFCIRQENTTTD